MFRAGNIILLSLEENNKSEDSSKNLAQLESTNKKMLLLKYICVIYLWWKNFLKYCVADN